MFSNAQYEESIKQLLTLFELLRWALKETPKKKLEAFFKSRRDSITLSEAFCAEALATYKTPDLANLPKTLAKFSQKQAWK
jgi:hypothetical protein